MRIARYTILIFLAFGIFACKKQVQEHFRTELENVAYQTLKTEMSSQDFATLDWNTIRIENSNQIPSLLKIKSINRNNEIMLFSRINDKTFYNWISLNVTKDDRLGVSGSLIITSVKNKLIQNYTIINNKIRTGDSISQDNALRANEAILSVAWDPHDLGNVTVTAYRNNTPSIWYNMYYLFGGNVNYVQLFTNDDALTGGGGSGPNGGGGSGNNGDAWVGIYVGEILSFQELSPETSEILDYEIGYKDEMSIDERQIYENMSRSQQLNYLYNAQTAIDISSSLYPGTQLNTKADAFRHAYFSALNVYSLGATLAKQLGDAHENKPLSNPLENSMDLKNNQIGRDTYQELVNEGNWNLEYLLNCLKLRDKIQLKIIAGNLWYLNPLDVDGHTIAGVTLLIPTNQ